MIEPVALWFITYSYPKLTVLLSSSFMHLTSGMSFYKAPKNSKVLSTRLYSIPHFLGSLSFNNCSWWFVNDIICPICSLCPKFLWHSLINQHTTNHVHHCPIFLFTNTSNSHLKPFNCSFFTLMFPSYLIFIETHSSLTVPFLVIVIKTPLPMDWKRWFLPFK